MKEFPLQAIRERAKAFEKNGFPLVQTEVAGVQFEYFVIPQELSPVLRNFALRMTHTDFNYGTPGVVGVYGVSDSVPPHLRDYWAFHEFAEFNLIGNFKMGRCKNAEEMVIDFVPEEHRYEYVERRKVFFEDLTNYLKDDMSSDTPNYSVADLAEVMGTAILLDSLSGKAY